MRPFRYERAADSRDVLRAYREGGQSMADTNTAYLAGGTTLLDLMKLDVMRPARVLDINDLAHEYSEINVGRQGLSLGALAKMADVAAHPVVQRDYPVIAQSLQSAASVQLRNMATLGGNVLQRTRCHYFRDPTWEACNKRNPGSGCAALTGVNRRHAILGVSTQCIAAYPGDFAQALVALDATVDILGLGGRRTLRFADLHRAPGNTPHIETTLAPGDLITRFSVPAGPWTRRSLYLKVRDRESYEFALASAAVALDLRDDTVADVRIALGGVAAKPWRSTAAEDVLKGKPLDEGTAAQSAAAAFSGATTQRDNTFKHALGQRTLVRTLLQAAQLKV